MRQPAKALEHGCWPAAPVSSQSDVVTDEELAAPALTWFRRYRDLLNSSLVAAALIALVITFSIASPYFATARNGRQILEQLTVVGVLTVGQALVIITAGIDLSQGSVLGLAGMVCALTLRHDPLWVGIGAGLLVGVVAGLFNAFLVSVLNLTPFIATLATFSIAGGLALLSNNGQPVFTVPQSLANFGNGSVGIFPYIALVGAGLAVLFQGLLSFTRFGRYTYAAGSNLSATRLAGINVKRHLAAIYLSSGVLAAIAGILQVAYVTSAQPTAGQDLLLASIASVVIGGASLFGGEGTVWGAVIGALLIAVLTNGTELLGISTYTQTVLLGLVVIIALSVDRFRRRTAV